MKNLAPLVLRSALFFVSALMAASSLAQTPRPAVPVEPIAAILDAFRTYAIVALSEGDHGNEQGHAFRLSLVRDPRFAATVNDIVVEFGSARYQDVMDRFVRGESIPEDTLRLVWQDTTVTGTGWDKPIYEEFFRAVRIVNAGLARERQVRVLLGDPPIDWGAVQSKDDVMRWNLDRDRHAAEVIRREVLAKQRRALVIYGEGHIWKKLPENNIVGLLQATAVPVDVFSISTNTSVDLQKRQADLASWQAPSLTMLRGTVLGEAAFTSYVPIPAAQWQSLRLADQVDALLYLGPPSSITMSRLPPARCLEVGYMEMRLRRMALDPAPPILPNQADQLKQYCAARIP